MPLSGLCSAGAAPQTHILAKLCAAMALISNGYKSPLFTFSFFLCFLFLFLMFLVVYVVLFPCSCFLSFPMFWDQPQCEAELDVGEA